MHKGAKVMDTAVFQFCFPAQLPDQKPLDYWIVGAWKIAAGKWNGLATWSEKNLNFCMEVCQPSILGGCSQHCSSNLASLECISRAWYPEIAGGWQAWALVALGKWLHGFSAGCRLHFDLQEMEAASYPKNYWSWRILNPPPQIWNTPPRNYGRVLDLFILGVDMGVVYLMLGDEITNYYATSDLGTIREATENSLFDRLTHVLLVETVEGVSNVNDRCPSFWVAGRDPPTIVGSP